MNLDAHATYPSTVMYGITRTALGVVSAIQNELTNHYEQMAQAEIERRDSLNPVRKFFASKVASQEEVLKYMMPDPEAAKMFFVTSDDEHMTAWDQYRDYYNQYVEIYNSLVSIMMSITVGKSQELFLSTEDFMLIKNLADLAEAEE